MESSPGVELPTSPFTRLADLPPKHRRRLLVRACVAPLAAGALFTVAYFLLPFDHISDVGYALALSGGLLGVVAILVWEVRAILRAAYPGMQAIGALTITIPLVLLLFSTAYFLMSRNAPEDFTQHLTRLDALYFTVTTFATVGFGDITARNDAARVVVIVQMLVDLALIGFGVKVIFGAVQMGRQRQLSRED